MQTYIFKLARTGEGGEKVQLLLESGARLHTTRFARDKSMSPSPMAMKLRKHLRGRRATDVCQLGVDRVVDLAFGSGAAQHHVLLELFAAGNLVLTDSAYRVEALLREYRDEERGAAAAVGLPYPVQALRMPAAVPRPRLAAALAEASPKLALKSAPPAAASLLALLSSLLRCARQHRSKTGRTGRLCM